MNTSFIHEELLETAKASPLAVSRHDKLAWTSLFFRQYMVEDPVGSKPHRPGNRGIKPLERFYDTFIDPNEITFHVDQDIVAGNIVARDVTIEITMTASVTAYVPMHLLYKMASEDGIPKIQSLRAHWELFPMIKQVVSKGLPGIIALNSLGFRMMRVQGIGGILGFARGFFGIYSKGKDMVGSFVEAANQSDSAKLVSLFDKDNQGIAFPGEERNETPESFCKERETILAVCKLISSGYFTSFTFAERSNEAEAKGIGVFRFNPGTRKIQSAHFYRN
jgi:hypothetical protein